MEPQQYLVVAAVFILAAGTGFIAAENLQNPGEEKFKTSPDLKVTSDNPVASTRFDNHYLELRLEDTPKAKFYYKFNDSRGVQQIKGLQHDGTLQTLRDIKSFGNQTYFLYLRYKDNPNQTEDSYMKLYRIEET